MFNNYIFITTNNKILAQKIIMKKLIVYKKNKRNITKMEPNVVQHVFTTHDVAGFPTRIDNLRVCFICTETGYTKF